MQEGDGIVPDFEDKNPNPMKFVGSQQVGKACDLGLAHQLASGAIGGCLASVPMSCTCVTQDVSPTVPASKSAHQLLFQVDMCSIVLHEHV